MWIMPDDKPMKSSYDLAMERLRKRDEDEGVVQKALTDEQKAAIAELRTVYKAKLAELEILQQGRLRATVDPAERQALEDTYRRERERLTSERDAKIDRLTA
jgi:hypothetical protein